jgi:hypothetical protein
MSYQEHVFTEVQIVEFKGNKILELPFDDGSGNGVSFGMKKAKAILANIEAIKKFVASDGKEC